MIMPGVPGSDGRCTQARPASRLERVCGRAAPDAPERVRSKALYQRLTIGRPAADQAGASLPSPKNRHEGLCFWLELNLWYAP